MANGDIDPIEENPNQGGNNQGGDNDDDDDNLFNWWLRIKLYLFMVLIVLKLKMVENYKIIIIDSIYYEHCFQTQAY